MDIKGIYFIKREIQQLKDRVAQIEAIVTSTTQNYSAMPKGGKGQNDLREELIETKSLLSAKLEELGIKTLQAERQIMAVDDPVLRLILRNRYINNLSWRQVAFRVGGGNTEESVRQAAHRFLKEGEK